jgi:hypothetical protein
VVEVGRNLQVKTAAVKEARKQYLMATPTEAISKPCTAAAADAVRESLKSLRGYRASAAARHDMSGAQEGKMVTLALTVVEGARGPVS